jgi:GNAT superfamily N-acetyltransferase
MGTFMFPKDAAHTGPRSDAGSGGGRPAWQGLGHWVPIRNLRAHHRPRIEQHLLSLSERDRYLRFGYAASDDRVRAYVASLNFERDEVFGIFNRQLELVAMAHLAYLHAAAPGLMHEPEMVEFAVSVRPSARGQHHGSRLFAHAVVHARNRGVERLFIHALSENTAMLRIARHAGAVVERDGAESEAWLRLPPDNFVSHLDEMMATQAAELNYGLKLHRRHLRRLLGLFGSLKRRVARLRRIASP